MLEQTGEYRVEAPRDLVWRELNDPDTLGQCISGCQDVTRVDDEHFDVTVKAKIGPVSATFQAALELTDLDPPNSYVINGSVKGGAAGFAKGSAQVNLTDDADATILRYVVNASVGGKLAQIGSRLVDGAARKMANDFFAAFAAHLSGNVSASEGSRSQIAEDPESENTGSSADESVTGPADATSAVTGDRKSILDQWLIWVIAVAVLGLGLVLSF